MRARFLLFLFSLCLHGAVFGTCYFARSGQNGTEEQVYHVSLADFSPRAEAAPPEAAAPPAEPESPPPPPEPEVKPEAEPEPPKEPEAKVVSAKKKTEPKAKKSETKAARPVTGENKQAGEGVPGAQPRDVGGLSAYASDQVDQRPSISRRVAPGYPAKAKRMGIEGKVVVQLVVDIKGEPRNCTVRSADPPGYFEDPAVEAAGKMRFIPGKINGRPVNTLVMLPFAFQLR